MFFYREKKTFFFSSLSPKPLIIKSFVWTRWFTLCRVVLKLTPFRETPNVDLSIFRSPVCTFVISDTSASQRSVLGRRATPMAMFGQLKADIMLICYHIWGEQMRPNCLKYRQGRCACVRVFVFYFCSSFGTVRGKSVRN